MEKYNDLDIAAMIDTLDELQNSQLLSEALEIQKTLIEIREGIVPFLKLSKKDSSFIHYFSAFFIPACDKEFLVMMKQELFAVIDKMDLTEYVDLLIAESLIKEQVFIKELSNKLLEKQKHVQYFYEYSNMNKYVLADYLDKLSSLLKI
ncbi:hypothetical protein [Paenibacillus silagei]|uniref:Immunity protein 30 domain-containing protein n=1 Tax=Paenibacillus silagei TaxID=1670801 RepID=A0ABS4P095_9BACL|nr:hypothetical protein [Paenibacillus silagei]MBP2114942.1 hypothetical protein [Paenibacillus silagei]